MIFDNEASNEDYSQLRQINVALVGASGVGKTCLAQRMQQEDVSFDKIQPTVGSTFFRIITNYGDENLVINITDTAGQEKYRAMTPMYYRNAQIILLCFALNNPASLDDLNSWKKDIDRYNPGAKLIVVGTKSDLEQKTVETNKITELSEQIGALATFEKTSAVNGENVTALKTKICEIGVELDIGKPTDTPITLKLDKEDGQDQPAKTNPFEKCCK